MSEPNYIKCHIYTMDGTVKDYDINPNSFSFDYMKYLYKGELYFQERLKNGKPDNKVIYKEDFDGLVSSEMKGKSTLLERFASPKRGFMEWREENKKQYEEYVRKSKMTKCKVCNGDIAKSAKICPHCGATRINNNQIAQILSVIVVLAAIIGCFYAVKYTWHNDTYSQTANTGVSDNTKETVSNNETLIFEDAYIKAYYIKLIEPDAIQGAFYLQLRVENKSTQEITVSLNNASVNGMSTIIGSGFPMEIQAGNASKQPFIVFSNNLDINSVADISDIDFSFYLMDKNMHVIEETDIIKLSV